MADNANSNEREELVDRITEDFLERLRRNDTPSTSELAKEHPDLAPDLEKRLKLVESIFKASELAVLEKAKLSDIDQPLSSEKTNREGSTVAGLSGSHVARIACPHCGNKVQLVGLQANELTCGSCGSSLKIARRPVVTERSKNALPKRLGRFTIKSILGEGAFGIVFLGLDPKLDREVAIKTPRNGFFPTLDEERRFFREAKHAARLNHPNIVRVLEVCENEGSPLIVSEYINGLTLNDVASKNSLTFKETAKLIIQIANAVEYAHQKGVVHRDLKPSNILLDEDWNAFVTDFGLAYRDDAEITMTLDGAILGTPAYMSPEQADGNQRLTGRRSDVYSLGVILYRLTTRDLPFHGTKRMLVQQVIHDDPKPPRSLNDRIPHDLETITLKAMSKSPDSRYQSAAELAEELQRFLMGEPILARPVSSISKFTRWCVRRPVIATLSGSIAALLVLCATISMLWAFNADRLRQVALKNEVKATENGRESTRRLHDLLMSNGVKELEHNYLTESSLWFAEALAIEDTPNDRIRLAMIQDRTPTLTHLVTGLGNCLTAFSNSGTRLAAAYPNSVRVFDSATRKTLFEEQVVSNVNFKFAPDGTKLVVSAGNNQANSVGLWNVDQRRLQATLMHTGIIQSIAFDSSSLKLVTGSTDSSAKVWNAIDGTLQSQHTFEGFLVARVTFINTNLVAVELNRLEEIECKIVIWDYTQDMLMGKEMLHDTFVATINVSSDGKRICTGEEGGTISVWDVSSGDQIGTSIVTKKKLQDAQFTADDNLVIGLFENGEVSTYEYQSGSLLQQFTRSTKFDALYQSPDRSILGLASADGKAVFIWRESGADVCPPISNGARISSITFHPDGHQVAVAGSNGALQCWDLAGSCPNSFLLPHSAFINNAIFAPKTNRCITVSRDGKGYIWDVRTGQRVGEDIEHGTDIYACAVALDGNSFATGGSNKLVKVWDSYTGKQIGDTYAHEASITALKFNQDGSCIFVGDADGSVRCWELNSKTAGDPRAKFELRHNSEVKSLRSSYDGSITASASKDGSIQIWDAATGRPISAPIKQGATIVSVRFLPDGKHIVFGDQNGAAVMWDLASSKAVQTLSSSAGGYISDIRIVDNGRRVLVVDLLGSASLWAANEKGLYQLENVFNLSQSAYAQAAGIWENNSILAVCGGMLNLQPDEPNRGMIKIWNLTDRRLLAPILRHRGSVQQLQISDDQQQLLTMSDDKTAQLWNISSTNLPPEILQRITRLYAQFLPDSEGGLQFMDNATQLTEFEALKALHPSYFAVDDTDRKTWSYEVKLNSSGDKP